MNTRTKVNLTKLILTATGNRYCPVVLAANGRVKPDVVVVDGNEEKHPEGAYYIDWNESGKRRRLSVGRDAGLAQSHRLRKEGEITALAQGFVSAAPEAVSGRFLIDAISTYIEETKLTKKRKTILAYSLATRYFYESFGDRAEVITLESLDRMDMLKFGAFLRTEKGLSPRTCRDTFANIMTFLKAQGIIGIVKKGDWPRYVLEEVEIYEKSDLQLLMKACTEEERLWWDFFLMTGMRMQEVMHATDRDINYRECTVKVSWKPEFKWDPKAYKEREIPVPQELIEALKKRRRIPGCHLLFPTAGCKPDYHFLDQLKACAIRAGLDSEQFYLHKFRATFATWCLWGGEGSEMPAVDLRTVQEWMGHSDIESTMCYLKPARNQGVRDKVNGIFSRQVIA
jgi:integrase/recombinase XerD